MPDASATERVQEDLRVSRTMTDMLRTKTEAAVYIAESDDDDDEITPNDAIAKAVTTRSIRFLLLGFTMGVISPTPLLSLSLSLSLFFSCLFHLPH